MSYNEALKTFGQISAQLVVALGMQAENMQRQALGASMVYGEEQFEMISDSIGKTLEEVK